MAFVNDQAAWDPVPSDPDAEESDYYSDASDGEKLAVLQSEKHFPVAARSCNAALSTRSKAVKKLMDLQCNPKPTPAQVRALDGVQARAEEADDAFQVQRRKLKKAAAAFALRGPTPAPPKVSALIHFNSPTNYVLMHIN